MRNQNENRLVFKKVETNFCQVKEVFGVEDEAVIFLDIPFEYLFVKEESRVY